MTITFLLLFLVVFSTDVKEVDASVILDSSSNDLIYDNLPTRWDEGVPLGNGPIGGLVWKKKDKLRISLDRSDLWDLRPSKAFSDPEINYKWITNHRINGTYDKARKKLNAYRTGRYAPTKLPGGALEFDIASMNDPKYVRLYLSNALCEIKFENDSKIQIFTHATKPIGWFRIMFDGEYSISPELKTPEYEADRSINEERVGGQGYDILYLDYKQGEVISDENSTQYHQECWGGFYYDIAVKWTKKSGMIEGVWSITSKFSNSEAKSEVEAALKMGFEQDLKSHTKWWKDFWAESSISIPDKVLQKQWYNEIYKIGATARPDTPPISLQAVWTADDDRLPPWRGDYHHDLNTQMSYWPFYTGNKLKYEKGFVDWLWSIVPENVRFTKEKFGVDGLNVPGMTTLEGKPMFGWIQYAMSPTTSGWLAHHFYLHWKYSNDRDFLENKAYPYLKYVAEYFDNISVEDENGMRRLPISSSPEIFDNHEEAWFTEITNYDLANIKLVYTAAAEMANELKLTKEADHYYNLLSEWPDYDLDEDSSFTYAPGAPYDKSHRHFSHLMAFHPYGLIDFSNGERHKQIIEASIERLDKVGSDWWCGYSYSWLGNLKARAMDGEGAADALRIFSDHFCTRNTFHVNGDQTKSGKSNFTYRPFTLEGNFAFAAAINEMLIQSHTGIVNIFPAIPDTWENVSFENLRTIGAFLVSADRTSGTVEKVEIISESNGLIVLSNPFPDQEFYHNHDIEINAQSDLIKIKMDEGQKVILRANDT